MHSKTSELLRKKSKPYLEPNMKTLAHIINNRLTTTNMKQILILPVIIWNKNRFLKWSDFKKKIYPKDKASAISAIGFESEPIIEHIKTGTKFTFKIKDMQLHAIFIPNLSGVIKNLNEKNMALLLKHEQGHFDLAEEITRKARIKANNRFKNRFMSVKGKNQKTAEKNATYRTTTIRKNINYKLQKDLNNQETKYDDKTKHGLSKTNQQKYNKRFKKLRS